MANYNRPSYPKRKNSWKKLSKPSSQSPSPAPKSSALPNFGPGSSPYTDNSSKSYKKPLPTPAPPVIPEVRKAVMRPKAPEIVVSKEKDQLIRSLQVRWWYVIPEWPDPDCDYITELQENKLILVADRDLMCDV